MDGGDYLGLLMLLQFSIYLIFRPEHPITWEDKRAVIEYCEYKYSGKAAIKESDAIQYGVDQTDLTNIRYRWIRIFSM